MLFGEKFYPLLNKMPAWRHSLFALVLATRQYPNFALWCEVKEVQGKTQYLNALKACWHFHYDKFNHVDLSEEDLLDLTPIQAEMSFQIDLMEQVRQPRSPENVIELCRLALESGCSNIGLESELTFEDFSECFVSSAHAVSQDHADTEELDEDSAELEPEPDELEGLTPAARRTGADSHDYDEAAAPWDEQDLIVFSPDCPEGFTPPKDLHAQLAAAHDPTAAANEQLAPDASDAQIDEQRAPDEIDEQADVDTADTRGDDYDQVEASAPQSVPSYAEMKAREAALATSTQANADQDLELAPHEPDDSASSFEVAPEDLARTAHNLRQALAEQETAAALLEQLTANNERLGAEEELIMAQAQAMAQDEARARSEHVLNSPQAPEVGPQVPATNPDDADGEVDVDLEFERIAQTAALLEQQLEQELLLETGQNLDSIIASGADPSTLRRHDDEGTQEQPGKSKHAGGKGHKDGKHHKGHHDHHKDKGSKDGKDSKFKSEDKEHGPKGKFKGDKPFKSGKDKDGKSDKWGKPFKGDKHHAKGDKLWHSEQEGKAFKDKDGKPGKSGKWSKSEKPFKGDKQFKDGKGFKGDKPFKDGKPGKKHGGKGHEGAAPKVFGAHAPKGKTV